MNQSAYHQYHSTETALLKSLLGRSWGGWPWTTHTSCPARFISSIWHTGPQHTFQEFSVFLRLRRTSTQLHDMPSWKWPFSSLLLFVPAGRLQGTGEKSFTVAVLKIWNQLPPEITFAVAIEGFKNILKTHLFCSVALRSIDRLTPS